MTHPVFTGTDFITLGGISDDGTTLSWITESNSNVVTSVFDNSDDGNLDSTVAPDYFFSVVFPYSGYTVEINGNTYAIFLNNSNPSLAYIPYDISFDDLTALIPFSPQSTTTQVENGTAQNFCFAAGTGIATPDGEVAVEHLQIGDLIVTAQGKTIPVKWIGRQTLAPMFAVPNFAAVRIRKGALGGGLPHADLTVSADHGMIVDGLVVNAAALVNGTSIDFVPLAELGPRFTWYHVETEAHDAILAHGAPAETFLDVAGRAAFDNHDEYLTLYGTKRIIPEMPLPRISSRRLLPETIKARLGIADPVLTVEWQRSA